jgi:Tfp pilus assembly protein PilN
MVKLNLLPPQERTKKQTIKENVLGVFLSVVALIIFGAFTVSLIFIENGFNSEIKSVSGLIEKQKSENNTYKKVEDAINNLNENIELVDTLKEKGITWSALLDEIRNLVPKDTTLSDISVTSEGTSKNKTQETVTPSLVIIKGSCQNLFPIAKLRSSLDSSETFEYVDFDSASGDENSNTYEFVIKLKIKI